MSIFLMALMWVLIGMAALVYAFVILRARAGRDEWEDDASVERVLSDRLSGEFELTDWDKPLDQIEEFRPR